MNNFRVRTTYAIGIDPGPSTGLAIIRGDGFKLHVQQGTPSQVLDDFALRFPFLCTGSSDVVVGCERFIVTDQTARRSSQPVPQQVIGIVQYLASLHNWKLRMQAPSDVKSFVSNMMLRETKLWSTGRDVEQHDANDANDAMRHALAALAFYRASMFDAILTASGV